MGDLIFRFLLLFEVHSSACCACSHSQHLSCVTRALFSDNLYKLDPPMNQFRDITMMSLIILAIGLLVGNPDNWTWAAVGGPYVVNAINFLAEGRPWSIIVLLALALTLFMTRLKY